MFWRALACALVLLGSAPLLAHPAQAASFAGPRVLVQFAPGITPDLRDAAIRSVGGAVDAVIPALGVTRVALPAGAGDRAAIETLEGQAGVASVEADAPMRLDLTPNDPLYSTDPYVGLGQWGIRTAGVDRAWDVVRGSPGIVVATIDTGVDPQHPDLLGALLPGVSFLSATSPGCVTQANDDNSHGTHVAGIIGANGNNTVGIAGVAFGVRILPIKALDCTGSGTTSDVSQAIVYAADHGARIINISLGSPQASATLQSAVSYARNKNVLVVAAAGNCGVTNPQCGFINQVDYPAAYPGVLAVGATQPDDTRASFSTQASYVAIAAPGYRVVSTTPTYATYLSGHGGTVSYGVFSGTSQASPFVAGVAALVLSKEPNLTPDQVTDRLRSTAVDLGTPGVDTSFGAGRVDAYRAVTGSSVVPAPGGDIRATYDTSGVPAAVATGLPFTANVKVNATGTSPLGASFQLGYSWLDPVTRAVVLAGTPTALGTDVRAGTSLVKTLTITAPPLAGVFLLRFDLAPLGGVPLSLQGSAPADVIVNVSAGYGATYSPAAVGASLVAGAQSTLSVSVKNTGIRTWAAGGISPVRLSYHWLATDRSVVVWNGARGSLAQDVAPGATAVVVLPLVPPSTTGTYLLRLDLVEEGVTWFSGQGVATSDIPYAITNGISASFTLGSVPTILPGGRVALPVTVKNDGIVAWAAGGTNPVHAALHLYDGLGNTVSWDGARTVLASDVQPGATVTLSLVVDAPLRPGIYRARPDLVQEGVAWFGALGSPTAAYTLVAVLPDYRGTLSSGPLTVSRANPVAQVTVTNTSSALWTAAGVAPVQLSVHWLDAQGTMLLWDGPRTKLARDFGPGETATVAVALGAIPPGAAFATIDLISEGVTWFGAGAARPVVLTP